MEKVAPGCVAAAGSKELCAEVGVGIKRRGHLVEFVDVAERFVGELRGHFACETKRKRAGKRIYVARVSW